MTLLQVTIEVEAESPQEARLLASQAGFTVKRVAQPRTAGGVTTPPHPFVRASAALDRPEDLTRDERHAYNRGYAAGCLTYVKKWGIPRGNTLAALHAATREAEWARHPAAHKKGLAELARFRTHWAAYTGAQSVAA